MWLFDIVVTWQIKNILSRLSQGIYTPNLAGWWLRMRKPHPQSHVTHWPLNHVTTQRRYIITFTRPMYPKQGGYLGWGSLWIPNWAGYWLFCGYYNRGLHKRKLVDPSISLSLFFCQKKYNISYVKEDAEMQRKACACRK